MQLFSTVAHCSPLVSMLNHDELPTDTNKQTIFNAFPYFNASLHTAQSPTAFMHQPCFDLSKLFVKKSAD